MTKVTKTWTMKNGTKIRICDMGDQHLLNTIKMLERMHDDAIQNTPYPSFQGEMAQFYAESEWEGLQESDVGDVFPIYNDLLDECYRRGLTGGHI